MRRERKKVGGEKKENEMRGGRERKSYLSDHHRIPIPKSTRPNRETVGQTHVHSLLYNKWL